MLVAVASTISVAGSTISGGAQIIQNHVDNIVANSQAKLVDGDLNSASVKVQPIGQEEYEKKTAPSMPVHTQ